jgi:hypothetical protein
MWVMDEQANNVAGEPAPESVPKRNAGWFQQGDGRINRDGRPRKSWAACADRAPRADRLMLLWVPRQDLDQRLTGHGTPGIGNLPADYQVVGSRVDPARDAVALVIRSASFPRIAKGAPIPEFTPELSPLVDLAPTDDRLRAFFVPGRTMAHRLGHERGFWALHLPSDLEIVACRVDPVRKGVLFTIRSETYPLIARGAPIPEFTPTFYGLKWQGRR